MLVWHRAAYLIVQFLIGKLLGRLKSLIGERRPNNAMSGEKNSQNDVGHTSVVMPHQQQDSASLQS